MPTLVVTAGPDLGRSFPLVGSLVSLGRHSSNGIALHDDEISRRHLELAPGDGGYVLTDLGSGNGTLVNGTAARTHALRPGDEIAVGRSRLRYEGDPTSGGSFASAIRRAVPADLGSQILANPGTRTETRLAHLAVLYEAANVVSEVLNVDELLARILELVRKAADADHGCFLLTDPDTGELMPKAVVSRGGGHEFAVSRTAAEYVLANAQAVLAADAADDPRFAGGESIARHQMRELICAPMRGRHGTLGVLFLDSTSGAKFDEDHLRLAVAVAHQAALAVEETRYYQALVHAERLAAVGQTIAALSHHIKNIMQGVRFGGDMVRMALDSADDVLLRKGWKLVERNQGKIDELILDMLSYSREREAGTEATDLPALLNEVCDVVRGRAAGKGVSLLCDLPALPRLSADPDGLQRAFLNIVSNAVDAVQDVPGGRVTITASATAAEIEVVVADNGPGIPPEKFEEIFRPFVSTKGARGTGLGLPVSRKILREHGGDLVAENAPGGGARFVFHLPLAPSGAASDAPLPTSAATEADA